MGCFYDLQEITVNGKENCIPLAFYNHFNGIIYLRKVFSLVISNFVGNPDNNLSMCFLAS